MKAGDLLRTPSEHNILWAWVNWLLPADSSSAWGFAMAIFSSSIMFAAALFLGWHVIAMIVRAAYKGETLSHSVWTPIRVVVGFGMMVPISMNFSSAHHLLRDGIARPAINLADATWVSYVDYAAGKNVRIAPQSPGGRALSYDILESEICAAVYNVMAERFGLTQIIKPAPKGRAIGDVQQWIYGHDCGAVTMVKLEGHEAFTNEREEAVSKIVTGARELAEPFGEFFSRHDRIFSVEQTMDLIVNGHLPIELAQKFRTLGDEYDAAIVVAVDKAMNLDEDAAAARQRLVDAARQQGVATAGMWWSHVSARSQQVAAMTGQQHDRISVRLGETGSANREHLHAALETLRNALTGLEAEIGVTSSDLAAAADDDANFLTRAIATITRPLSEWVLNWYSSGADSDLSTVERMRQSDPIGDQVSSGHYFMWIAYGGIVAVAGLNMGAASWIGSAFGADGAVAWFSTWLYAPLGTLWIIGAVRAYILPILPFIYMWVFAALWLLAVLEAAVALVVWAFSFIRLSGEEFLAEQSKMGAMLLFNVFLMPVLGMLAFMACFELLPMIVGGLELFWATAFYGQTGGSAPGLGALIVGLAVITFLSMYLIVHIFGQIFHIPDKIITWFGGSSHGFADKSFFAAVAGGAAAVLGRGMPGLPSMPRKQDKPEPDPSGGKGSAGGGITSRN